MKEEIENKLYTPTEEQLQEWGKPILDSLVGFTKDDIEPLFERFVIPVYIFASRRPGEDGKYKIVNRETGKEYAEEKAISELRKLLGINW